MKRHADSASDTMARIVAERLQATLGQPVIVENWLGALVPSKTPREIVMRLNAEIDAAGIKAN